MTLSRRRFIGSTGAVIAMTSLPLSRGMAASSGMQPTISSALCDAVAHPPVAELPRFRWWWPGGFVEPAQVQREVAAMARAGFGGFEIADVRDGVMVPVDPRQYGWGAARWVEAVEAALEAANQHGLKADITLGAHWPTGMPGLKPDDDGAAKELVHGAAVIEAGGHYSGAVPSSATEPSGLHMSTVRPTVTPVLVAVAAYREVDQQNASVVLDFSSRTDLLGQVKDGQLEWSAPGEGRWHLLAFWMRGTAQTQNMFDRGINTSMLADPTPYAVDVYGRAGAQACIDYWETHLLRPRTRELLRLCGGNFFEDSLELKAVRHWSVDLPGDFQRLRGYDLLDYLPLLAASTDKGAPVSPWQEAEIPRPYLFKDVDIARFDADFSHTLTEMYAVNRIKRLSAWAATLGMGMRAQCSGLAASYCDVPEGDNGDNIESFSAKAAARDIGGHRILSDEAATFVGGQAHVADWKLLLFMLQRDFAGGVNQVVLHGFSYADAPGASWPGFSAFGRAIGNDWGPRSPLWQHASDVSGYLGRLQHVLQGGLSQADLAVLEPVDRRSVAANFNRNGSEFGESLRLAGYTRHHLEPDLLLHPNAIARDGVLTPDGAAYRALLVMPTEAMAPEVADRLVEFAAAGVPIIAIGPVPAGVPGLHQRAQRMERLAASWRRLLAMPTVTAIADTRAALDALSASRVAPSLQFSHQTRILAVLRRHDDWTDHYLLNDSDATVELTVSCRGEGVPAVIDAWNGSQHSIESVKSGGGRTGLELAFRPNEVRIVRLYNGAPDCKILPPVTKNIAPGKSSQLDRWSLEIERWTAGDGMATRKQLQTLELPALASWRDIPQIADASGIGTYSTTFDLPSTWRSGDGAVIDLGRVGGSFRVQVNGQSLPALNQFDTRVDVSPWARSGRNTVSVEVATTLNNCLKAMGASAAFPLPPGVVLEPARFSEAWQPPADADPTKPPKGEYLGAPVAGSDMMMSAGATGPGGERTWQQYGLIGPVVLDHG